jgi:hypothetical protein
MVIRTAPHAITTTENELVEILEMDRSSKSDIVRFFRNCPYISGPTLLLLFFLKINILAKTNM